MSEQGGPGVDVLVGGVIATVIALVCIYLVSLVAAFPWSLGQTLAACGIASFSGSVVSYVLGFKAARKAE